MHLFVAVMQLSVAAAFLSIPFVRNRYGAIAMASAQAELHRQGVRTTVLEENGMRFDAGGHETAAPAAVAAVMVTLAGLHLAGSTWAVPLTWAFQSLVLVGNGLILYSGLTAVASVQKAFRRKGDPMLAGVEVPALLKAAEDGFPAWTWTLQKVRHIVVFGASLFALVALVVA
jgi:hypothetical protein